MVFLQTNQKIHSICFADGITLMVKSEKELNIMMKYLNTLLTKLHLKINTQKTKALLLNKTNQYVTTNIEIIDETIYQVKEYCYL